VVTLLLLGGTVDSTRHLLTSFPWTPTSQVVTLDKAAKLVVFKLAQLFRRSLLHLFFRHDFRALVFRARFAHTGRSLHDCIHDKLLPAILAKLMTAGHANHGHGLIVVIANSTWCRRRFSLFVYGVNAMVDSALGKQLVGIIVKHFE
jgi:hypothetical protein